MIMRFSTCDLMVTMMLMVIGNVLGSNGFFYKDWWESKKIKEDAKHCKKVLSQQTSDLCEKRLGYCCRSGKNNITQPVCASTINGFGKIFDNPCSLFYIRCMYPEVCFLKRSKSHPHCRLVLKQESPFQICSSTPTTTDNAATTFSATTRMSTTLPSTVSPDQWITEPSSTLLQTLLQTLHNSSGEVTPSISNTITSEESSQTLPATSSSSASVVSTPSTPIGHTNDTVTSDDSMSMLPNISTTFGTTSISTLLTRQWTSTDEGQSNDPRAIVNDITTERVTESDNMTLIDISTTTIPSSVSTDDSITKESFITTSSVDSTTADTRTECGSSSFVTEFPRPVSVCNAAYTGTRTTQTFNVKSRNKETSFKVKCNVPPPTFLECAFPMDDRGRS